MEGTEVKFTIMQSICIYWTPRQDIWELASGSTVPTPLMAAEEAEKQNQGGINYSLLKEANKSFDVN